MDFNTYQKESRKTAIYEKIGYDFVYPLLGLNGEAGEITEKCKKAIRDNNGFFTYEMIEGIAKELGDVLWYISQLATEFGLSLNEVAEKNIEKLQKRMEENKLHGSGDNR